MTWAFAGSMAMAEIPNPKPALASCHDTPPSMLLYTPSAPAYAMFGLEGSTATTPYAMVVEVVISCQWSPPSELFQIFHSSPPCVSPSVVAYMMLGLERARASDVACPKG